MLTRKPPHGLFVTGTDTDVGKTFVGAMLAAEFRRGGKQVGVYKPVASGCRTVDGELVPEDAAEIAAGRASGTRGRAPSRPSAGPPR